MTQLAEAPAWQQSLADQVAQIGIPDSTTHLVVHRPEDGDPILLDLADSEDAGIISAEDHATKVDGGEVTVVPLTQIQELNDGDHHAGSALEQELANEGAQPPEGTSSGPDPENGKLFDVPRVTVIVDETDPTVLKLSLSGGLELDRATADDVAFYNRLKPGQTVTLTVEAHVAGAKTTHRRDSEGNVDAVVQTKSLIIHSLDTGTV